MTAATSPAPATTQVPAPTPIPFRTGGALSGGEVAGTLATTVGLLATLAAAAWYARRRGWLDRWATAPAAGGARLRVLERLRLSPRTTVFRVADGDREWLLVESPAGTQAVPSSSGRVP